MNWWATIFFSSENEKILLFVELFVFIGNLWIDSVSWQWRRSWWVVTTMIERTSTDTIDSTQSSELCRVYAANYSHWMIIVSFIIISLVVWTGLRPQIRFPSWKLNLWLWRCLCTWNILSHCSQVVWFTLWYAL